MQNSVKNKLYGMGILGKAQKCALASENPVITIEKRAGDCDFSTLGAIPEPKESDKLFLSVRLPREAGLCGVKFTIAGDGGDNAYFKLYYRGDLVTDEYSAEIPVSDLPMGLSNGLYYYHFELDFGTFTLYTRSINNADFELCEEYPYQRFRLLVHERDLDTPEWFKGNIMYHIFVDRFFKGTRSVPVSKTAVINPDWENGIPQYGEYPGAFVENNMFFGGTLYGIAEKLDYLEGLGVGCIYLSPIFKAYSNHKYDTGDYMTVDEMFGGEDALRELISKAEERGIKIVLDGVFNHTGDDSLYFNRYGRYDSRGAYGNADSPFRSWYSFEEDGSYKSWWGIEVLPKLNQRNPECKNYFLGKDGVIEKYFGMGIGGIRLDVADELPDEFLDGLYGVVRGVKKDGLIIGEVWENAADKVAYGERRRYFRGGQLDSVMNYPMKNAVIELVKNGDSEFFYNVITELYSSYPKACSDVLMNILGTHDTDRILTVLAGENPDGYTNAELSVKRMTADERTKGVKMLCTAATLQYTLFGSPSVFYADEAGSEGYRDPFCRMPYPWGRENAELLGFYKKLGQIRRSERVFAKGSFEFLKASDGFVSFRRFDGDDEIVVMANCGRSDVCEKLSDKYTNLYTDSTEEAEITVSPMSAKILKKQR
ncbi:MAG: glycoside hydrolase family 13 protein [Clostridia bacterium]|nr:glycoside hydrolase family 13 protein [Clostridia bacterium]